MRRPPPLLVAAGLVALAIGLLLLGGLAVDRWPFGFDRAIMLGLRTPGHLDVPVGPRGLKAVMIDVTALGSVPILTLAVLAAVGLLLALRRQVTALLVVVATSSAGLMVELLKHEVGRPRPTIVPHLVDASGLSFPSGHSAGSAATYLTLAALATQVVDREAVRRYLIAVALLLVGAIGVSRVYLGVHWPSDVLAGWSFGTLWALGWWKLGARFRESVGPEREQPLGGAQVRRVDHAPAQL